MNDADALLRAILANPDDDLPRLVYADWLEEHGESERAEFIRVQCELAGMDISEHAHAFWRGQLGPCPDWVGRANALRERERELLRDWTRSLLGEPEGLAPCRRGNELGYKTATGQFVAAEFRRGFVYAVSCTLATFAGGPCGRCGGSGDATQNLYCFACSGTGQIPGTGRTPGVAKALFASQPVERVTLTDREPYWHGGAYCWYWDDRSQPSPDVHGAAELPGFLFQKRNNGITPRLQGFDTPTLAREWLSARCVAYGRGLAGLPPLKLTAAT